MQHFGHRCQAICRARGIRHNPVISGQCVMIYTIDNGFIRVRTRCRNKHTRGTTLQMQCSLVTRGEYASTFQHHIYITPRQGGGVAFGRYGNFAQTKINAVAIYGDITFETAMRAVITKQMRARFNRPQIVYSNELNIITSSFNKRAHDVPANTTETVNSNLGSQFRVS